jgi:3-oxoacyl-[acyl-carrier protein] reductase
MNTSINSQQARVAIVTGGSRGIGRAISKRLAADGFSVVLTYAGNEAAAHAAVDDIRSSGGNATALLANVSSSEQVAALFDATVKTHGRVDVVVHSAGVMELASLADMPDDQFDRIINVNLRGTFLMMKGASRALPRGGRFIAISSSVIAKNLPGYGAYTASKSGVESLVHVFANELRGREITVNAVAPGPVATALFLSGKSEEQIAQIAKQSPLERLAQPEDIVGAVSFLAGPDGAWVNSQVLRVNGGFA